MIRWDIAGGRTLVTVVAAPWDRARVRRYRRSRRSLRQVSDAYVRRWGPTDAQYLWSSVEGGALLTSYRSRKLAAVMAGSTSSSARVGRLTVAIVLDSLATTPNIPLAWRRSVGAADEAPFTVAVTAGTPWVGGVAE
jgi:hypothetical protein